MLPASMQHIQHMRHLHSVLAEAALLPCWLLRSLGQNWPPGQKMLLASMGMYTWLCSTYSVRSQCWAVFVVVPGGTGAATEHSACRGKRLNKHYLKGIHAASTMFTSC